jgi:putative two-component system response regulator
MGIVIARHHHERWDGKGYPDGLKGEDIPLSARIMAVVDVYDALVSERSYKKALSHEESCQYILAGSGTQFDPLVVEAFAAHSDDFRDITRRLS